MLRIKKLAALLSISVGLMSLGDVAFGTTIFNNETQQGSNNELTKDMGSIDNLIPDPVFREYLKKKVFHDGIDFDHMTYADFYEPIFLYIDGFDGKDKIKNLNGLQYFRSLQHLSVVNADLSSSDSLAGIIELQDSQSPTLKYRLNRVWIKNSHLTDKSIRTISSINLLHGKSANYASPNLILSNDTSDIIDGYNAITDLSIFSENAGIVEAIRQNITLPDTDKIEHPLLLRDRDGQSIVDTEFSNGGEYKNGIITWEEYGANEFTFKGKLIDNNGNALFSGDVSQNVNNLFIKNPRINVTYGKFISKEEMIELAGATTSNNAKIRIYMDDDAYQTIFETLGEHPVELCAVNGACKTIKVDVQNSTAPRNG